MLLRELVQELPVAGMDAAWKRAKMVLRHSELDPAAEPLLTKNDQQRQGLTGEEPLFWAGYILSTPPGVELPATPPGDDVAR